MSLSHLSIRVIDREPIVRYSAPSCLTEIRIKNYSKTYSMPVDTWSVEEYEQQWREGLERIKTHDTSCLIGAIQKGKPNSFINWWILYKEGNTVYIQQNLTFNDTVPPGKLLENLTVQNCYSYITPREIVTDGGAKRYEWKIKI